jgi:methyl-accepting chemotaxis protein
VARDAEVGAEAISKTIHEIGRIKETSGEAREVIAGLGRRIASMGAVFAAIDDVAERTSLLALNAAIVAAQAGAQGRGFSVVAEEMKELAERAGSGSRDIAALIDTLQAEAKRGIDAVERGASAVERGVDVSAEAEGALKKILESAQKSTAMVRAIARATIEQAKGSRQVTESIGRIADTVQQIAAATAEQARGSELITGSAEAMRLVTKQVERSSLEQARGSREALEAIEHIHALVAQLHEGQRLDAEHAAARREALRHLADAARAREGALRELGRVTERLRAPG